MRTLILATALLVSVPPAIAQESLLIQSGELAELVRGAEDELFIFRAVSDAGFRVVYEDAGVEYDFRCDWEGQSVKGCYIFTQQPDGASHFFRAMNPLPWPYELDVPVADTCDQNGTTVWEETRPTPENAIPKADCQRAFAKAYATLVSRVQ